ncbi:MAG TPA: hypothetical protein VFW94_14970 [Candidatus Acidoferrales bacterium]|nr:hypothetical protein [Candidatus Acidoferrales bacterium]
MHNPQDFSHNGPTLFDKIGDEPLAGSGFETENPEPEFTQAELFQTEPTAPGEE